MSAVKPGKPLKCLTCYDVGVIIDPFDHSKRQRCQCQPVPDEARTPTALERAIGFIEDKTGKVIWRP